MSVAVASNGQAPTLAETMAAANARYEGGEAPPDQESPETTVETTEGDATETTDEPESTTGDEPKADGKSHEVILAAIEANVPQEFIDNARDNEQLLFYVRTFGSVNRGDDKQSDQSEGQKLAAELAGNLSFPEEELDDSDPVHRRLKAILDNNKLLANALGKMFDANKQLGENITRDRETSRQQTEDSDFDAALDGISFGKSRSAERYGVINMYRALLRDEQPRTSAERQKLAVQAVYAKHPELVTKAAERKQAAAIDAQRKTQLGGGAAKPPAGREMTMEERLKAAVAPFVEKARQQRGY